MQITVRKFANENFDRNRMKLNIIKNIKLNERDIIKQIKIALTRKN